MLSKLSEQLKSGEVTAESLLGQVLESIQKTNPKLNAFIEVESEQALKAASEADKRRANGSPLSDYDGIPIGIKDNIAQTGRKVECCSKILKDYVSPYSATVIQKLESAGMIPIGHLNMDEFAMGSSTENSIHGPTLNPHDTDRAPGGSSGGSAAAVAAGMVPVSLGSDTGGSIRQPAAFCGVYGHKPTYGSVSRYGLVAFASSLDQIGPFATNVEDIRIIHNLIAGEDPKDSTSVPSSMQPSPAPLGDSIKVGLVPDMTGRCSAEIQESIEKTKELLSKKFSNVEFVDLDLGYQKFGIPVYYLTATSEASANLARFDGMRYGQRVTGSNLAETYEKSRTEGFGKEVKRRILLGTYALSSGYYDAYYGKAQQVRSKIRSDYEQAFQKVDCILMPSTPTTAFKLGEKTSDPVEMYLSDLLTVGASLAGIPALGFPGPAVGNLPIGLQLQGNYFEDEKLFQIAEQLQSEIPFVSPSASNE